MNLKQLFLCFLLLSSAALGQSMPPPFGERLMSAAELGLKAPVRRIAIPLPGGKAGIEEESVFDRSGRVIERTTTYSGDKMERLVYKYDAAGRLAGSTGFIDQVLAYTVKIKLNADGLPSEMVRTDYRKKSEKPLNWSVTCEYKLDAAGRILERITRLAEPIGFSGGFVMSFGFPSGVYRETFRYDERGNKADYALYLPKLENLYMPKPMPEVPFIRIIMSYDARNRKIEQTVPPSAGDDSGRLRIEAYRYNDKDDLIETRDLEPVNEATQRAVGDRYKVIDSRGTVQNGLLISDRPNTILWGLIECSYSYDRFGNWISKACTHQLRDGKLQETSRISDRVRTIEYYPN